MSTEAISAQVSMAFAESLAIGQVYAYDKANIHCLHSMQSLSKGAALAREKQLKGDKRDKKIILIEQMNPE